MTACTARRHGTRWAYRRLRCTCPGSEAERRAHYRQASARRYIPGRVSNRRGAYAGLDPVAVDRAVGGDRDVPLSRPERRAAIDRLDASGLSAAEIARRLGVTTRTVTRRRAARRMRSALLVERYGPLDEIETEEIRAA